MSIKTPRLTRNRCGVYYFRLVVPLALRKDLGKTEYRRSLDPDAWVARAVISQYEGTTKTNRNDRSRSTGIPNQGGEAGSGAKKSIASDWRGHAFRFCSRSNRH